MFLDWELIEASFAQQYGIRLRQENYMPWTEFTALLSGLSGETPLGVIIRIRTENNPERLQRFSSQERKMRRDWHMYIMEQEQPQVLDDYVTDFKQVLKTAFGER